MTDAPASVTGRKSNVAMQWREAGERASSVLEDLLWPIVFLSWLPFISSNMILQDALLSGFDEAALLRLMPIFPHFDPALIIVLSVVGVAGAYAFWRRCRAHVLVVLPLVLPLLVLLFYAWTLKAGLSDFVLDDNGVDVRKPATGMMAVFSFAYSLTVVMSVLVFCLIGEITDNFFWPFYAIAFLDCILAGADVEFSFYGLLLTNYWPSIIGVSLSFMVIFLGRATVMAFKHNRNIRAKFGGKLLPATWKALTLWWPMLGFFAFMTYGYHYLDTKYFTPSVVTYLNDFETVENLGLEQPAVPDDERPKTIDGALKLLVERLAYRITPRTEEAILTVSNGIRQKSLEARNNAKKTVEEALPKRFPGTETSRCSWYDVVCHLKNGVKSMTNRAYVRIRNRQMSKMQEELDSYYKTEEDLNDEYAIKTTQIARAQVERVKETSQQAVVQVAKTLLWIGWALSVYAILVLLKSFLVVFARVLYLRETVTHDDLGDEVFGSVTTSKDTFRIPDNCPTRYLVKNNAIGLNVVERKRLALPLKAPFVRLFTGAYVLSLIDTKAEFQEACDIRVDPPAELALWKLARDEVVAFRFSDFIAISEGTSLKTAVSLRLSSLIFGRILYHYACGPGELILKTRARAIAGTDPNAGACLNASGIVAWNIKNEYNVISNLSIMDTFFSGCGLKKTRGDLIVYDSSRTRLSGGILSGIWRFGRVFLVPF